MTVGRVLGYLVHERDCEGVVEGDAVVVIVIVMVIAIYQILSDIL